MIEIHTNNNGEIISYSQTKHEQNDITPEARRIYIKRINKQLKKEGKDEKVCNRCFKVFSLDRFSIEPNGDRQRRGFCKKCEILKNRKIYVARCERLKQQKKDGGNHSRED